MDWFEYFIIYQKDVMQYNDTKNPDFKNFIWKKFPITKMLPM